jgi:S1-C subfamily serine protease
MVEPSIRGRFFRVAVAVVALAAVLTAILASILLPVRSGEWRLETVRNTRGFEVLRTLANGPAAKDGVRPGDEIVLDLMPLDDRVAFARPIAGVPVQVSVERHGQIIPIALCRVGTTGRGRA